MKKLIAAIVIASVGASSVFAQSLVYDYRASIRRLDFQIRRRFVNRTTEIVEKFNVVNDTIMGYVVLPKCTACVNGQLDYTDAGDNFAGYAYLTLVGNRFAKVGNNYPASDRVVMKTQAVAKAAVFGSEVQTSSDDENPITVPLNPTQNTKAWMSLDYAIHATDVFPDNEYGLYPGNLVNGYSMTERQIYLGFLGAAHMGNNPVDVSNTGFGTTMVTTTRTTQQGSTPFCGPSTPTTTTITPCTVISSISGTLVGYPRYSGPCRTIPMWDLCTTTTADGTEYTPRSNAVICGSWILRYNAALSNVADASKQESILTRFNRATTANMFQLDRSGNIQTNDTNVLYEVSTPNPE